MLEWQASLQEPLKARNGTDVQVYVEDLKIGADGTVFENACVFVRFT